MGMKKQQKIKKLKTYSWKEVKEAVEDVYILDIWSQINGKIIIPQHQFLTWLKHNLKQNTKT